MQDPRPALIVAVGDAVVSSAARPIILTCEQRGTLRRLARALSAPHRQVLRARIVLAAACGVSNAAIAVAVGVHVDTVRKWRSRFAVHGLDGLHDRARCGRPRRFTAQVVAEVKALACELPTSSDLPLARWSCLDLAREANQPRCRGEHLGVHRAALAGRGCHQALATPILDLSAGSALRG